MTPGNYSPKNHAAHVAARSKHLAAQKQAKAANELARIAALYAKFPGCLGTRFDLCNAIINLIDDGDAWAERAALMEELNCDEEGNDLEQSAADDCEDDYGDYLYEMRRDAQMTAEWERAA